MFPNGHLEVRGPKAARIYAEEISRRGARVRLAFNTQEDEAVSPQVMKIASDPNASVLPAGAEVQETVPQMTQEVIVLRGGFSQW